MRKYSEYKNSGIPWIGNIPSHWNIERGKNVLTLLDRPIMDTDDVITCFRDGEVTLRKNRREEGFTLSFQEIGYQGIEPGDLVVHGMDGFAGAIGVSDSRGKATPVLNVMDSIHNKRFLMYYLRTAAYKDVFMSLSTGIRVRSCDLRWNKLSVFPFVLPEREEQDRIAEYIDDKLLQINNIISEAKASIEEYKAWKSSIIYEAVAKGLDPNVEMKDSGVEGINQIPSTWEIVRFIMSNYVRARLGWKGLKAEEYVDKGFPFLSAFNIVNSQLQWKNLNYITQERFDESPEIKLSVGDILLVKDGAGIGKCARVDSLPVGEATVNSSLGVITPNENIHYRYEYYYFLSPIFQNIISRLRNGMGVPHLTQEAMKEIYLPLPTLEEQIAISDYLDEKIKLLDNLIGEKEDLIEDLEDYKKSLIFEVVTGKKKVY